MPSVEFFRNLTPNHFEHPTSNSFTDRAKQDAMNLFLGYYKPFRDTKALWDYETDYHLHSKYLLCNVK